MPHWAIVKPWGEGRSAIIHCPHCVDEETKEENRHESAVGECLEEGP